MNSTGIIVLAAGASVRMGSPKQLLQVNGSTLLRHTVQEALRAACGPVLLVLGANENEMRSEVAHLDTETVVNEEWREGMGASIRAGIAALQSMHPECGAAVIMVSDQPLVHSGLVKELVSTHQTTAKSIVACRYADSFGPPVLFQSGFFPQLLSLHGDTGAKALVKQHMNEVAFINFEAGMVDLDTKKDYEQFIKRRTHDYRQL
ncbi:MAG: nucleotidyltransferase family protein [Bacteroidota bacterium]|nr:nucleotidyltransferase family protein [Bacteroidota bacterium]